MKLILSTHNLTLTKAIEDHILSRLEKLAHLDRFAIDARVTLEHDNAKVPERAFSCSIRLVVPGPDLLRRTRRATCMRRLIWFTRRSSSRSGNGRTNLKPASTPKPPPAKRKRQEAQL